MTKIELKQLIIKWRGTASDFRECVSHINRYNKPTQYDLARIAELETKSKVYDRVVEELEELITKEN